MSELSEPLQLLLDELLGLSKEMERLSKSGALPTDTALHVSDALQRCWTYGFSAYVKAEELSDNQKSTTEIRRGNRAAKLKGAKSRIEQIKAANVKKSKTWVLDFVAAEIKTSRKTLTEFLKQK